MASDYNTYVTSAIALAPDVPANGAAYPLWMYHPSKGSQVVNDQASQVALVASDSQWSTTDPNATT
jgi:hypothetical protein